MKRSRDQINKAPNGHENTENAGAIDAVVKFYR